MAITTLQQYWSEAGTEKTASSEDNSTKPSVSW